MTVACIIIASANRRALVEDKVLPSVVMQGFDEVVLVGDWPISKFYKGADYQYVEPITRTTTDALVKRDVGTLATTADTLVYLCDDHALGPQFGKGLRAVLDEPWDVLVPNRCTYVSGERVPLNMGEADGYCGGHGGVFCRSLITALPWTAGPHDRLWDRNMSAQQRALGARFVWRPRADIEIIDLEPEREPWR